MSLVPLVGSRGHRAWGGLFSTGTGWVRHAGRQWLVGVHHAGVYIYFWADWDRLFTVLV